MIGPPDIYLILLIILIFLKIYRVLRGIFFLPEVVKISEIGKNIRFKGYSASKNKDGRKRNLRV